jgi:hypothetical protein
VRKAENKITGMPRELERTRGEEKKETKMKEQEKN